MDYDDIQHILRPKIVRTKEIAQQFKTTALANPLDMRNLDAIIAGLSPRHKALWYEYQNLSRIGEGASSYMTDKLAVVFWDELLGGS